MNILIVPSWFQDNDDKNNGSFFIEQAVFYKKVYPEDNLFFAYAETRSLKKIFTQFRLGRRKYSYEGVNVYLLNFYKVLPFFEKTKSYLRYILLNFLVSKIEKEHGPMDLIHLHSATVMGGAVGMISAKRNIPFIITEHSSMYSRKILKNSKIEEIIRAFGKSKKVIAVSEGLKKCMVEETKFGNIEVINNCVDTRKFFKKEKGEVFQYCSVGNLNKTKGYDILVRAFLIAAKQYPEIKLNIGGEGAELNELKKIIKDDENAKSIDFLGPLSREEVSQLMSKSHAFLLASRFESFGIVYVEAMASGLPLVGTKTAGGLEVVRPSNGLLAEIDSVEEVAKHIIEIYEKYKDYDLEEIQKEAFERFDFHSTMKKYHQVYLELIN